MKYYTSTTQFNCGIDLHARQMYVCLSANWASNFWLLPGTTVAA